MIAAGTAPPNFRGNHNLHISISNKTRAASDRNIMADQNPENKNELSIPLNYIFAAAPIRTISIGSIAPRWEHRAPRC